MTSRLRDTRLSKIGNAPNGLNHLSVKKYPVYTEYSPPRPKFPSVSLYHQPFSRYKVVEYLKCTKWPQTDLNHLSVKSTVYAEYSSPRTKFHSVSLYDQPFSRYIVVDNRKCTEWPQNHLKHLTVESTLHTLNNHPQGPISIRFALWPAVFEIQGCRKSEMHQMALTT